MKNYDGYSIVEIIVVLGVITVLLGLGGVGISLLLQNSRDTQRTTAISQMAEILNDYKKTNLEYPATNRVTLAGNSFSISSTSLSLTLNSPLTPSTTTTQSQTKYVYTGQGSKFSLCTVLESGEIKNVGQIINTNC